MSEAPDEICPAYTALALGPGTLARAQALHESLDDVELEPEHDQSKVLPVLPGQACRDEARPITEPAPPRERPSKVYVRVHEELSQFIAPDAAEYILDEALEQIGATRAAAGSLDFRETFVELVPELLTALLPEERMDTVLWALESALVDVHRPSRP
jgi:hypothetical protein